MSQKNGRVICGSGVKLFSTLDGAFSQSINQPYSNSPSINLIQTIDIIITNLSINLIQPPINLKLPINLIITHLSISLIQTIHLIITNRSINLIQPHPSILSSPIYQRDHDPVPGGSSRGRRSTPSKRCFTRTPRRRRCHGRRKTPSWRCGVGCPVGWSLRLGGGC